MEGIQTAKLIIWFGRATMQGLAVDPGKCRLVVATLTRITGGCAFIVWFLLWSTAALCGPQPCRSPDCVHASDATEELLFHDAVLHRAIEGVTCSVCKRGGG